MSIELQNVDYLPNYCAVTGVYRLQIGDYFYIGSGISVGTRRSEHLNDLKAGTHRSPKLQAAWDKHQSARFIIIQETQPKTWLKGDDGRDRARMLEHEEIQKHFGTEFCCNQSASAYGNTMLGEVMREKWKDGEYRERTVARLRNRRGSAVSVECRRKMALAKTGAKNSKARSCTLNFRGETMTFATCTDAAAHFGVTQQAMNLWLTGGAVWPGQGRTPRSSQARMLIGLTGAYDS